MCRFEAFRAFYNYNHERSHKALGQILPERVHAPSPRRYNGVLRSPDYDAGVDVRRVRRNSQIKWRSGENFVSGILAGEPVGLRRIGDETWLVEYGPVLLGTVKRKSTTRIVGRQARSGSPRGRLQAPHEQPF